MAKNDEAILREVRERYRYASEMWREAREERKTDMRYVQGDPWEPEDRAARAEAGRPCISHDELNQYTNACINNVRQNKRGIKIGPEGNGANERTSAFQQSMVRTIERTSRGPNVYVDTFQQMVEGSYGFFRVSREYLPGKTFDQRIVLKPIANPDSVTCDWDAKEPDWSDQKYAFVIDGAWSKEEFKRRWPNAEVTSFTSEDMRTAPDWIQTDKILVCEYWSIEETEQRIYLLADGTITDDLRPGQNAIKSRSFPKKQIIQRFTNGVEILEETAQPGSLIPIIPMIGLRRWVDDGAGPKRKINSLIRLARDPQMSHAYLCSQEMEEAGLSPKTPYVGYVGQFETDQDSWRTVTKIPHGFLQVDVVMDTATGQPLPLPQRQQFTPNFQAYEIAKDSCRRAIQAAMGISPLPTAAQRNNEKSGVALEKITDAQNLGSYHFIDSFDMALQYAGRVILDWIPVTYDTEREMALFQPDESHEMARINTPEPYADPETGEQKHYRTDEGDHYPDISEGPSYQSQQEEAASFLDTLIGNLKGLPIPPPQAAKLLAIAIRMRRLGPLGDEMADTISPPDQGQQLPPQAQAAVQQAQQHSQALYALVQQLQGEIAKLQLDAKAKVIDNQGRMAIERMKIEAGIAEAEIATKAQMQSERQEFVADAWQQLHGQAHEAALQADDQAHQQQMQDQQQGHEQGLANQQADLQQQQLLQAQQQQQQQQGNDNENS